MVNRIARVFPRRTKATPDDQLAFVGEPDRLYLDDLDIDEVHISVAFSYDMQYAEWLALQWEAAGVPVKMGGPAFKQPGGEFTPGMYIKHGYTITSRGCPNKCWFCGVPEREGGKLTELPIKDGWDILDDNLLACSDQHIREVFAMLERQPNKPKFTGGLEAKLLKPWHAELIRNVKTERLYCAYDTPDDYEPLVAAGRILRDAGITTASHVAGCYVLIGYWEDTFDKAEERLIKTIQAGFMPFAMLWQPDDHENDDRTWNRFQREWCNERIVGVKMKEYGSWELL